MSIFYEGPNFFASGRIFRFIYPKIFARSQQHCMCVCGGGGGNFVCFDSRHLGMDPDIKEQIGRFWIGT
jgi:hypothetical protein